MALPFTVEQFFECFRRYNVAVWPAQGLLFALGVTAIVLAFRGSPRGNQVISGILAFLWAWMGLIYHGVFFRTINPAASLFGLLFVVQAVVFAWEGIWQPRLAFRARLDRYGTDSFGAVGGLLVGYSLIAYPALGYALGHRLPAAPTFGLPCPTTIFTLGLLMWTVRPVPRAVLVVPALWTVIGTQGAFAFGMWEDMGLLAAGLLALPLLLRARARPHEDAPAR